MNEAVSVVVVVSVLVYLVSVVTLNRCQLQTCHCLMLFVVLVQVMRISHSEDYTCIAGGQ